MYATGKALNAIGGPLLVAGVLAGGLAGSAALAQQVGPQLTPDLRLEQLPPAEAPPAVRPELPIPETAPTRVPPGAETIRFQLQAIDIEGALAYPGDVLDALSAPLIGREVTLAEIYEVRAALEKRYRDDGYFLTRVIVPAQTVRDGRFRIQVIEGYIDSIEIEGDIGPVEDLVRRTLARLIGRRPLSVATLERYLLLANDIPGVRVRSVLRPSPEQQGAAQLVAQVERKPLDAVAIFDNYGDEFTGILQMAGRVAANSFTPAGEQVAVTGLVSDPFNDINGNDNEWIVQFASSWRYGWEGLFSELLVSYGDSDPGFIVDEFNFDTKSLLVGANVGYPVIRSRDLSLTTLAGFDVVNTDTDIFGGDRFVRDRLRTLYLTARGQARDAWRGNNTASLSLRQGIGAFGASTEGDDDLSREDGTSVATVFRGNVARQQPLFGDIDVLGAPGNFGLYGTMAGQYAFDRLLNDDLFDIGGSTQYGRGYDSGELSGDHGFAFTGEVQFTHRLNLPYFARYQLFGFYDYGRIWIRGEGNNDDEDLSSAGGGIRATLVDQLSVEFQIAKPLTFDSQRSSFGRDPQFLFRIVGRL